MAQKQGGFGFGSRLEWPGLGQRQGDSGAFRPRGSKVPRRRPQPRCLRETKRIIASEGGICVVAETDSLLEEDGFEPPVPLGPSHLSRHGFVARRGGRSRSKNAP